MIALAVDMATPANEPSPWTVPMVTFASVVLAQLVIVALYFAGRRADDRRRWHDKRLEAYSSFTSDYREMLLHLTESRELLMKGAGDAVDYARAGVVYEQLSKPFFDIQLLGTDPVRRSADELLGRLAWFVLVGELEATKASAQLWDAHLNRAIDSKDAFDDEVRKELGISKPQRRLVVQADGALALFGQTFAVALDVYAEVFRRMARTLGILISRRK